MLRQLGPWGLVSQARISTKACVGCVARKSFFGGPPLCGSHPRSKENVAHHSLSLSRARSTTIALQSFAGSNIFQCMGLRISSTHLKHKLWARGSHGRTRFAAYPQTTMNVGSRSHTQPRNWARTLGAIHGPPYILFPSAALRIRTCIGRRNSSTT